MSEHKDTSPSSPPSPKVSEDEKYMRLYAEFENYKKRTQKEKEEIKNNTKVSVISSILDIDNDITIALKSIKDEEVRNGIRLITNKLDVFLKSEGIESIQTRAYDEELHEVISIADTGGNLIPGTILDVVSKGYSLHGKPFRYPKIILSK